MLVITQCGGMAEAEKLAKALEAKGFIVCTADFEVNPKATTNAKGEKARLKLEAKVKQEEAEKAKKAKTKKVKLHKPTLVELKEVLTELKEELGTDALKDILIAHDAKNLKTLDKETWPTVYATAKNLLKESNDELSSEDISDYTEEEDGDGFPAFDELVDELEEDDEEDDLFLDGDEDGEVEEIDLAELKKLASRYADKHGLDAQREVMGKHGIPTTRSLGKASDEQLAKIAKGFNKGL